MKKILTIQSTTMKFKKTCIDCFQTSKCLTPQNVIMLVAAIIFSFISQLASGQSKGKAELYDDDSYTVGGRVIVTFDTTKVADGNIVTWKSYVYSNPNEKIFKAVDTSRDHKTGNVTIYQNVFFTSEDMKRYRHWKIITYDSSGKQIYKFIEHYEVDSSNKETKIYGRLDQDGKVYEYDSSKKKYSLLANIGSMEIPNEKSSGEKNCYYQPYEVSLLANYLHAGDNYYPYNAIGGSGEVTRFIKPDLGITIDAGYYTHSEIVGELKRGFSQLNVAGGISYLPMSDRCCENKFSISTHALFGISNYTQTIGYSNESRSNSLHSVMVNVGAAIDWKLSPLLNIRLAQVDYTPTLFGGEIQQNFRFGIGASISLGKKSCAETKTGGLPVTIHSDVLPKTKEKRIPTTDEEDSTKTDEEGLPTPQPWNYISNINGYEVNEHPKLYKPNDEERTKQLDNPHSTEGKNCRGIDMFDFPNGDKPVIGTLEVKSKCECKIHVRVLIVLNRDGKDDKEEKKEGNTQDKDGKNNNDKMDEGKGVKLLFEYDVVNLPGSDLHIFNIDKNSTIRISIRCTGGSDDCLFTRKFSTTGEDKPVTKENPAPRLTVLPSSTPSFEQYDENKILNRCVSKEVTFYKFTNVNVNDDITIYFKPVSECGCYFEAYVSKNGNQDDEKPNPKTGGNLGSTTEWGSGYIDQPDNAANRTRSKELFNKLPPGKTIFIKGRCPNQMPKGGPCSGHVEITGITFTNKK